MIIQDRTKGYLFAFTSVIATSNVFIFSKAAMKDTSLEVFGFYWFLLGLLWNIIFNVKTGNIRQIPILTKRQWGILSILGLLEVVGTTFFFLAIFTVPNPAIVSFLGNINPLIVTLLGFLILKERYNRPEIFGIFLVIVGAFVISYKGGDQIQNMFISGAEYVLLSGLFFGASAIVTKMNVKKMQPSILALSRTTFLLVFSFIMLLVNSKGFVLSQTAFINIFIGSILGPFLTVVAGYQAYKYLEVSRVSILGSTKGIFVLIGAYIYLDKFPEFYQIIGGMISIVGVVLISLGKLWMKKRQKSNFQH
jgi:drug/metabolite transporter (DMT)-like permease